MTLLQRPAGREMTLSKGTFAEESAASAVTAPSVGAKARWHHGRLVEPRSRTKLGHARS